MSKLAGVSFVQAFSQLAGRLGEKAAIEENGTLVFTYSQLLGKARAIAQVLQAQGLGPEQVVALGLPKSACYVAGLLGVWFGRAAFVPLDPDLPGERQAQMLRDLQKGFPGKRYVLVNRDTEPVFRALAAKYGHALHCLLFEDFPDSPAGEVFEPSPSPGDLAYIIFTSGSTGEPKGVMLEQRGLVPVLAEQIEVFRLSEKSRSLFYLSCNFDASLSDIGTALLSGATLVIEEPHRLLPTPAFLDLLEKRQISYVDIPPSVLRILSKLPGFNVPGCLKSVVIGGEVCPADVIRQWANLVHLVNVYGPTEATICSSYTICDSQWQEALIGKPLAAVSYLVRSEAGARAGADLQIVSASVFAPAFVCALASGKCPEGELLIAGETLARGYLNRQELTAQRFPIFNGIRYYASRDRVRRLASGNYEFRGRIDRQVKLKGLLIEPEEIEQRLLENPLVLQAAVLKRSLYRQGSLVPVREGLVAFLVLSEKLNRQEIQAGLADKLPLWMLPQRYEVLEALPLTATGKVDYDCLCAFALAASQEAELLNLILVRGKIFSSALIAQGVKDLLACDALGEDDNFFDLGLDSLAVVELSLVLQRLGQKVLSQSENLESSALLVAPELIMKYPSVRQLSEAIERQGYVSSSSVGSMSAEALRQDVVLNPAQVRFFQEAALKSKESQALAAVPRQAFFTGAAGFLGARFLWLLLKRLPQVEVIALVRCDSVAHGLKRIEESLASQGFFLGEEERRRIKVLPGDLARENFGLELDLYEKLAREIDTIFHLAAQVNMVLPYEALRPSNVAGTMNVARFQVEGKLKFLHYASTLSVFVGTDCNSGLVLESDDLAETQEVYGGYAQTKWAAEVFLRSLEKLFSSTERTLPINYFRFGLITGDRQSGLLPPRDFLSMFVQGLVALNCLPQVNSLPQVNESLAVDITPCDYAAQAMLELALYSQAQRQPSTYHLANSKGLALDFFLDCLAASTNLPRVSLESFEKLLLESTSKLGSDPQIAAAYFALCRLFAGDKFQAFRTMDLFQATNITFDCRNSLRDLAQAGCELQLEAPDEALVMLYLKSILKRSSAVDANNVQTGNLVLGGRSNHD
jgi:amino acid adenylation domain-containing protein/thioester reductase-like protein